MRIKLLCLLVMLLSGAMILNYSALAESPAFSGAQANNSFAIDLYRELSKQEGNIFFSPASISTALSMAASGASGSTRTEMNSVLHVEGEMYAYKLYADLLRTLLKDGDSKDIQLKSANSLWIEQSFQILPSFKWLMEERYKSEIIAADFSNRPSQERDRINSWVDKNTEGRIKELIPPDGIQNITKLVIANAVYFYGKWSTPFNPGRTKAGEFHNSSGSTNEVPFMHLTEEFNYNEENLIQYLRLPYADPTFEMEILLPVKGEIDKLASLLNTEFLDELNKKSKPLKVAVTLPRFKIEKRLNLAEMLASLGMADAFDANRANFSGIDPKNGIYISKVIHKAFITVEEAGTEAAASTAVIMAPKGLAVAKLEEPKVFTVDHPFVFLIRHKTSGAILFFGRIDNL